jgi:hypothetical protein
LRSAPSPARDLGRAPTSLGINQNPASPVDILTERGFELTGGITPQGITLATNHVQVIKDTHGKTSQLSQSDLDALVAYVMSLQ